MCKRLLQFLQEQRKHLQSGFNLTRGINFLLNVKQLQLGFFFVFLNYCWIMSETKPNSNKNRKGKKKKKKISKVMIRAQHRRNSTTLTEEGNPTTFKRFAFSGCCVWKIKSNPPSVQVLKKKQEPKIHLHYEAPAPHPLMASEHTKQWESGVAPLQPTALSWFTWENSWDKSIQSAGVQRHLVTEPEHQGKP